MPPDLLSFLNKLVDTTSYKLEWQGINIDNKYSQLKERFPNLSFNKLLSLAILLQHIDINIFNNLEIIALSNLNIELINLHKYSNDSSINLLKNTKLFDTKSSRLYTLIDINSISKNILYQANSTYDQFSSIRLKEFITMLYNQGY